MTLLETAEAIRSRRLAAIAAIQASLDRISTSNGRLRAFLSVAADRALARASTIDAAIAAGDPVGSLAGVPIALKDNLCTSFGRTTCASRILQDFQSPYDAHVVARLEQAGAILVGKTNLDEFAMGSSTETGARGAARNPWDDQRVAGGSSGGSAVAVASGMVPAALGSDTGGSVRQPAALCGIAGLKPTYGLVSRYGLVAYASSLDQIGPLGRTAADVALLLQVIAGHDPRDSTCVDQPVPDYVSSLDRTLAGVRIGMVAEHFGDGLDEGVRARVTEAIDLLRREGARVVDIRLPNLEYAAPAYYIIATAEASSNLARFDGVRFGRRANAPGRIDELYARSRGEGFGREVKRRIVLGTYALSSGYYDAYYLTAAKVRTLIKADFDAAFEQVDVIASPATPTTAFRLGEKLDDPLAMFLSDVYTLPANLAGVCALSVPCGFDDAGLPVGLQLTGPAFGEPIVLGVGHQYQLRTNYDARVPAPGR